MTKQEELQYLIGIVTEASKWTPSPDDQRDLVRMEVEERINNLVMGVDPQPDENGLIQSTIHPDNPVDEPLTDSDFKALEAAKFNEHMNKKLQKRKKNNEYKKRWKQGKVRVNENGKMIWRPLAECHKEPLFPDNPLASKFKWVWDGPKDTVDKLLEPGTL